jgi:hypothetical protein
MVNLSKYANIYYNTILISDCIINNCLNIDLANDKILSKIKITDKNNFYDNYDGIFKIKENYDATFVRSVNSNYLKKLFLLLPEPKIYSHDYDENIWNNHYVGFQTNTSCVLSKHKLLGYVEDDGTLNYSKNMIIPNKYFIRYQPLEICNVIYSNIDIKKELNSKFIIGVAGAINKFTDPRILINTLETLRKEYPNLNICLLILHSNRDCNKIFKKKESWIHIKSYSKEIYMNILRQIDVCVNTWSNKCIIYSGSNKNLDCIVANIPIIIPFSYSYMEIFDEDYEFFYNSFDFDENIIILQLYDLLKKIIKKGYDYDRLKNLYKKIQKYYNNYVVFNYIEQLNNISLH